MRWIVGLAVGFSLLAFSFSQPPADLKSDLAKLQGNWKWVGSRYWAYQFSFKGNKMRFSDSGAPAWLPKVDSVNFRLLGGNRHQWIVVTDSKPKEVKGLRFEYRFEGDRLILTVPERQKANVFTLERDPKN